MLAGLLALVAAAAFSSAALYINVAEHPARMKLDERALLAQWKPAYARGAPMQVSLVMLGFALGIAEWWLSRNVLWLLGALAMVAPMPWTFLAIMPINNTLKSLDPVGDASRVRPLLERWGKLHAVRTALGLTATLLYLVASLRP